jgi:hypothetical protein
VKNHGRSISRWATLFPRCVAEIMCEEAERRMKRAQMIPHERRRTEAASSACLVGARA